MNPTSVPLDQDEEALLNYVPLEGSVGNKTLREKLGWEQDRYFAVRNSLIEKGLLDKGRGKGGSVNRIVEVEKAGTLGAAAEEQVEAEVREVVEEYRRERDLYPKFKNAIERGWVRDEGLLPNVLVEITASQGARETGGRWSRPDVTVVAVRMFEMLPGKYLDVTTFEVKPEDSWDNIACVFETAAHSRAATQSILAIHTPNGVPRTADVDRVLEECRRFGVGLLTFDDPANFDTYEILVEPQKLSPNPALLDSFLTQQLSEPSKRQIRLWAR